MDVRHLIGKVAGFPCMRGDEPDRHAYMLGLGQIVVYLSRTQFQCMPEKATVSRRWLFIIDG